MHLRQRFLHWFIFVSPVLTLRCLALPRLFVSGRFVMRSPQPLVCRPCPVENAPWPKIFYCDDRSDMSASFSLPSRSIFKLRIATCTMLWRLTLLIKATTKYLGSNRYHKGRTITQRLLPSYAHRPPWPAISQFKRFTRWRSMHNTPSILI
jgi:hypothetical protein